MNKLIVWTQKNRAATLLLIFLFSLLVRFLTAEYLDLGGDNAEKWAQARRIAEGLGVTHWYNHSMRWTINLPLAGLIKLFGPYPALTYILPFTMASITAVFTYLIAERFHSTTFALAAATITILLPQMAQTGSQLWPGVFEMAAASAMVWLILNWIDRQKALWLILAGIVFALGWGARVTILYFYPGLVLLIWLPTRNYMAAILFTAVAAGLCFVEWGWFWLDSGNPMGRIGLLHATRGNHPDLPVTVSEYLLNILNLKKVKGLLPVVLLTIGAACWTLRDKDRRIKGIAVVYLIYMFLIFYMVSGIMPLKLALPFGPRNWPEAAPFGLMLLLLFLFRLKEHHSKTATALITILFLAFAGFSIKKIPANNSVLQMCCDYRVLFPALKAKQPIRMHYEPWHPNFIEKQLIETFTGQKKRKKRSIQAMDLDMKRNQQRLCSLFMDDISQFIEWKHSDLVRLDHHTYLFHPTGSPSNAQPVAESRFGRKAHMARALPISEDK